MKPTYVYKNLTLGILEEKESPVQTYGYSDIKDTTLVPYIHAHYDMDGTDVATSENLYMAASRHWEVIGLWPDGIKHRSPASVKAIEDWLIAHSSDDKPHVFAVQLHNLGVRVLNVAEDGVYWFTYEDGKHVRKAAYAMNGDYIYDKRYIVFHNAHDAAVFSMEQCNKKILEIDAALVKHQAEVDAKFAKGNEYVAMLQKKSTLKENRDPNAWWAMLSPEQKAAMMAKNK